MVKQVAVAEAYGQHVQSVVALAEAAFERNTATYRRLVARMAESAGTLPPDEADELVRVCETLGIPPERLSDDAAAVMKMNRLHAEMNAVHQRNTARMEPLPRLEAEMQVAQAEWNRIREECESRLRIAQNDLTAKRNAYEKLLMTRNESTESIDREAMRLRERNAHLFAPVSRETLQRIVNPPRERFRL